MYIEKELSRLISSISELDIDDINKTKEEIKAEVYCIVYRAFEKSKQGLLEDIVSRHKINEDIARYTLNKVYGKEFRNVVRQFFQQIEEEKSRG